MVTMLTLFLDWRVQLSHRRGAGTALCALAVATGLVLTGCGTESEPVPTATPTSTETAPSTPEPSQSADTPEPTTAEPTPEPIPPDPAQLINENTEEGAKSAVAYFIALHDFSFLSQDLDRWKGVGEPECEFCSNVVERIELLRSSQYRFEGGKIGILSSSAPVEFSPQVWEAKGTFTQEAFSILDGSGDHVEQNSSNQFDGSIFVRFDGRQWWLVGLGS